MYYQTWFPTDNLPAPLLRMEPGPSDPNQQIPPDSQLTVSKCVPLALSLLIPLAWVASVSRSIPEFTAKPRIFAPMWDQIQKKISLGGAQQGHTFQTTSELDT
mmetsp:Transcript_46755/g.83726  ORF Transcript_46755/g.83726 Transcript_46755/m.83726 type:complete len:103 (-) Transcript_46755:152-460(-)